MRTYDDCVLCLIRQSLDAVRLVTDDSIIRTQVVQNVLQLLGSADLHETPPFMAQKIHRLIRQLTKVDDPYRQIKYRFNILMINLKFISHIQQVLELRLWMILQGQGLLPEHLKLRTRIFKQKR